MLNLLFHLTVYRTYHIHNQISIPILKKCGICLKCTHLRQVPHCSICLKWWYPLKSICSIISYRLSVITLLVLVTVNIFLNFLFQYSWFCIFSYSIPSNWTLLSLTFRPWLTLLLLTSLPWLQQKRAHYVFQLQTLFSSNMTFLTFVEKASLSAHLAYYCNIWWRAHTEERLGTTK